MGNASNNKQVAQKQMTELEKKPQKIAFSQIVNSERYQSAILNRLGSEKDAKDFTTSIITTYNKTPAIQECTANSIIGAALSGSALKLPPSPQLGLFYMVPFKQKEKRDRSGNITQQACTKAEFVLGWRGYWQLALRSNLYQRIIVQNIKEGEFRGWNPLLEELDCKMMTDPYKRKIMKTVGYYGVFILQNGFTKSLYMPKEEMVDYADTYSPAFSKRAYNKIQSGEIKQEDMWQYSSFWYKDFDAMGTKTIVRQLIGHYGPISVETNEVQRAFASDNQIISLAENGDLIFEDEPTFQEDTPVPAAFNGVKITEPEFSEVTNQVNLDDL